MKYLLKRFVKNDSGATAIEYGLIAGIAAVAIIAAFTLFGDNLKIAMDNIAGHLGAVEGPQ